MKNIFWIIYLMMALFFSSCFSDGIEAFPLEEKEFFKKILINTKPILGMNNSDFISTIDDVSFQMYDNKGFRLDSSEIENKLRFYKEYNFEFLENNKRDTILIAKSKELDTLVFTKDYLGYAPLFSKKDLEGNLINLRKSLGKIIVLNFWFTKCQPCIVEMDDLNELKKKYETNDNVEFLGVTFDSKEKVTAFLESDTFDYRIVPEARDVIDNYFIMGFPSNMIIDQEGNFSYQSVGYDMYIKRKLDQEIQKLLKN